MIKKLLIVLVWLLSLILTTIYFNENPEFVEKVKNYFKGNKNLVLGSQEGEILRSPGNSFMIEFSEIISFSEKTAFIIHDQKLLNFNKDNLRIYFQNGDFFNNTKLEKITLPSNFTTTKNGGIKAIFIYKEMQFALISSLNNGCYYASIVYLSNGNCKCYIKVIKIKLAGYMLAT